MAEHPVYRMAFSKVYPLLVQKAERKGRTKAEVDEVICWLTGYDYAGMQAQIDKDVDIAISVMERFVDCRSCFAPSQRRVFK